MFAIRLIIRKSILIILLPFVIGTLEAQQYQTTQLVINNTEVNRLDVLKFKDKVSTLDYDKYTPILLPADLDHSCNALSPEVRQSLIEKYRSKNRRVVCFYLSDIDGVLLCLFDNENTMMAITGNTLLTAWTDQDVKAPFFDIAPEEYRYWGANLRAKDLKERNKKIKKSKSNPCIENIEKMFFKNIIEPEIKKYNKKFALITAYVYMDCDWYREKIIIHEWLHAKYFLDKAFKKIIDDYINSGFKDKNSYRGRLFSCIQNTLHDIGAYPTIYSDIDLRNTEIANRLLTIQKDECSLYKINPAAVDLYDQIINKGFKLPDLWYKVYIKTEVEPKKNILYYNTNSYDFSEDEDNSINKFY